MSKNSWTEAPITRTCPLCDGSDARIVSQKMQHGLDLTTVICNTCGMVFTNPVPSEEIYNRFYTEAYADYYGGIAGSARIGTPTKEPKYFGMILNEIQNLRPLHSTHLMEVGPGKGHFLYWARHRGATVLGVEPSNEFYNILQENGLPSLNTTLEKLTVNDIGNFDVIAMFHVLEHFYDPNRALEQCRKLLNEAGLLVIIVPNVLMPYRSLDRYFLRYVHLSNFSPETLIAMLYKHGFVAEFFGTQGNDWHQPRNLFLIARKLPGIPETLELPTQTAEEVESVLKVIGGNGPG